MNARLAGKTALVTGAASGVGAATARLFAAHGACAAGLDRPPAGIRRRPRIEAWFEREPGTREAQTAWLPTRRIGTPEGVAHTALFLAGDAARFINATGILIDGGRSQVHHD